MARDRETDQDQDHRRNDDRDGFRESEYQPEPVRDTLPPPEPPEEDSNYGESEQ